MKRTIFGLTITAVLVLVSGCATYVGDKLLELPETRVRYDQSRVISKARSGVSELLDSLGISDERKASFKKISPRGVVRDDHSLKRSHINSQLIVAGADASFASATNSIIIVAGPLHISHSANNIIICGTDVDISHDGSRGNGSLVVSKGRIKISHAGNSLIYALDGVEISHARNVRAFNTRERKTSWGHIDNVLVDPLFDAETRPEYR